MKDVGKPLQKIDLQNYRIYRLTLEERDEVYNKNRLSVCWMWIIGHAQSISKLKAGNTKTLNVQNNRIRIPSGPGSVIFSVIVYYKSGIYKINL